MEEWLYPGFQGLNSTLIVATNPGRHRARLFSSNKRWDVSLAVDTARPGDLSSTRSLWGPIDFPEKAEDGKPVENL